MIIGLVGRKRAGKDFAAKIIQEIDPTFKRVAFADRMREAMYALNPPLPWGGSTPESNYLQPVVDIWGWDKAKEQFPEVRRLLQRFGTEMGRDCFGKNFWVDLTWGDVVGNVVITDVRFKNEIAKVRESGGVIWRIERADLPAEDPNDPLMQHPSEHDWRTTDPDRIVINRGHGYGDDFRISVGEAVVETMMPIWMREEYSSLSTQTT